MEAQPERSGHRRMVRIGLVVVAVAAALLIAARALGWLGAGDAGALKLYGNVEIREVQLGFRVSGRIARLAVDEGDRVAAGQVLAVLDTRPLQDRLANADARLAASSAAVSRDTAGNRPQQIREAEAAVAAARADLADARRQHERRRALLGKGFISRADFQTSEARLAAAAAAAEATEAGLSLAREGVRAEDRAVTQANRAAVEAERRAVETDMADATLRAAEPGQVLTRAREAGAIVQPGETVLTLSLTQPVRVRAYVAEPDLRRIRPGMTVRVGIDGTGKTWPATIGFISPVAEFTPKTVQTEALRADLVYRLRLTVQDPASELRQGQPVTVVVPAGGK